MKMAGWYRVVEDEDGWLVEGIQMKMAGWYRVFEDEDGWLVEGDLSCFHVETTVLPDIITLHYRDYPSPSALHC